MKTNKIKFVIYDSGKNALINEINKKKLNKIGKSNKT